MTSNRAGGDGFGSDSAADLYRKWRQETDAGRESRQEDTRILDSCVQKMNFQLDNLVSERSRLQAEQQRLSDLMKVKSEEAESYETDLNRLEAYMRANDVNIGLIVQALTMARDSNHCLKRKYLEFLKIYNQERAEEEEEKMERNSCLQSMFMGVESKQMELAQLEAELLKIQQANKRKAEAIHSAEANCRASQLTIEMAKMELEVKTSEISSCVKRAEEEAHRGEMRQLRDKVLIMQERAKDLMKDKNQFFLEDIVLNADIFKIETEVERYADMLHDQSQIIQSIKGQREGHDREMQAFCSSMNAQYEETKRRLVEMNHELVDGNIELNRLEADDMESKSKCRDLRIEIAAQERIVSDAATFIQEMKRLEEDLGRARAELSRINVQEIKLQEQIDRLQVEKAIPCLQVEKKSLEDEHRAVIEEISLLENDLRAKRERTKIEEFAILSSLKNEVDRVESDLDDESKIIDEDEAEEEMLKKTIMTMDDNVNTMETAGSRRLQIIEDKNRQLLFQLASENEALEMEINTLKGEARKLEVEESNSVMDTVEKRTEQQPKSTVAHQKENQSSGSGDSDDSDIFRLFSSPKKMSPEKAGKKFFKRK